MIAGEALVKAGAQAVGLAGGCLQQVVATASSIPLLLPEQSTETRKKFRWKDVPGSIEVCPSLRAGSFVKQIFV